MDDEGGDEGGDDSSCSVDGGAAPVDVCVDFLGGAVTDKSSGSPWYPVPGSKKAYLESLLYQAGMTRLSTASGNRSKQHLAKVPKRYRYDRGSCAELRPDKFRRDTECLELHHILRRSGIPSFSVCALPVCSSSGRSRGKSDCGISF